MLFTEKHEIGRTHNKNHCPAANKSCKNQNEFKSVLIIRTYQPVNNYENKIKTNETQK